MAKRKIKRDQLIFWVTVGVVVSLAAVSFISDLTKAASVTAEEVSENIKNSKSVKDTEELVKQFEDFKNELPNLDWEKELALDSVLDSGENLEIFNGDELTKVDDSDSVYEYEPQTETYSYSAEIPSDTKGTLIRVIDGDTLLMEIGGKETRVRLIGVDTPESVAPSDYAENTSEGKDITEILSRKIAEGDTLSLEYDTSATDKYGRTLAYVYFANGEMIQDWLLLNGYAQTMKIEPDVKYADKFEQEAETAKISKTGLWNGYFKEDE